jgi:hypothetical protein
VILGHRFYSELILLAVDLPATLDAPFWEPSGRALWYSFGTLVTNAAALVLQVSPSELQVGARPVFRAPVRVHGELFLYDNVAGGAGYARAIGENLQEILLKALELAEHCTNPDCAGACYHCMYDYRNQYLHPILDRELGASMLRFVLEGCLPSLSHAEEDVAAAALNEFARATRRISGPETIAGVRLPTIMQDKVGNKVGLWVIHPLSARPADNARAAILAQSGVRVAVHTSFDLLRRPFWVLNHLL